MWADALMPLALEVGVEEAGERLAIEAEEGIDALLEESTAVSEELPSVIYREGTPSPSNLTPRAVDNGNLSFRDSLSNPYPLAPGQRPVFRPGEPYFGVNTSKLPPGSVINDQVPAGHVSVRGVPAATIKQAVTDKSKFPR